jgi:hypothetical protein
MAPPSTDKPSKVLSPLPAISAKYLLQPTDFVGGGDVGNSEDSRHLPLAAFARTKIMLLDPADDPNVAADPRQNSSNGNKGGGDPDTPAPEPAGILIILPALFCLFFVHMSFQRKTKCHDFNAACDRSRSTD